jgi:GH24 family phage-related lysozyme (muramidase)
MISSIEEQLARDEGRSLAPYRDIKGLFTIGIGHKLGATIPPQFSAGINDAQCDQLFTADLHHIWDLLDAYVPWWQALDSAQGPRSNVLVNMAFNMGCAGLSTFTTFLGLMRARSWDAAATDLRGTLAYRQLTNRYERLAVQIESGSWV